MNVQPPVQNRFIAFPGATQRDVVNTPARKPSLALGGRPNPLRGHLVAVRTPLSCHCLGSSLI